jgi:PilZ domain
MERRLDPRYPADLSVWVSDLLKPGHSAAGTICDISASGIGVVSPLPLAAGDVVRLDVAESVLFGIVTYATAGEAGSRTGIEVQRVLLGDSDLSRLLQRVLHEEMPAVALGSRS